MGPSESAEEAAAPAAPPPDPIDSRVKERQRGGKRLPRSLPGQQLSVPLRFRRIKQKLTPAGLARAVQFSMCPCPSSLGSGVLYIVWHDVRLSC